MEFFYLIVGAGILAFFVAWNKILDREYTELDEGLK